ncbi:Metal-pseudopaline receptor CntO [Methylophilaceae bacterium]|nr:Metal-pseudopaline receptor CntO [Methylophilaceae bacterium]
MKKRFALLSLLFGIPLHAETITETVSVVSQRENLLGLAESASEGIIGHARIANSPLSRPGEVLEQTPGMVASQHSGDGKANQYYLRGFNLDHGTDFAVWLEGIPLNMPTHAHGQGYTDANFLIPELIETLHYRKGPYYAETGDFSAAGSASLRYFRTLPQAIAKITAGNEGYQRLLHADSLDWGDDRLLYAIEAQRYDGPWEQNQNLRKFNGLLRYSSGDQSHGLDILAMAYQSEWDASDQVPRRAVSNGLIDRFGTIDDTDGGKTHRYSLSADWRNGPWQANAYAVDYRLNLFSNFTYFLDDPINGDQFEQSDRRHIFGGALKYAWEQSLFGLGSSQEIGLQTRHDDIGNAGLYKTRARQRLSVIREDNVKQGSLGIWWQAGWELAPSWRLTTGLRADKYRFDVDSNNPLNSGRSNSSIASPKLGLVWKALDTTDFYANWGRGFHSNDGRGSTIRTDPASGDPADRVDPLVKATGQEVGLRGLWLGRWQTTLALFKLDIDSELLFVGDAGATEASRPSRRAGVEWSNYLPINDWSYIDADFAVTRARLRDSDAAGNHIPGAAEKTASIGYAAQRGPWSVSSRLRYLGPRALIEDNSVRSGSSVIVNSRIGYQFSRKVGLALDIFNLFNRKVADIDYYYASRLPGEPADGVEDIHTHPAEPRMASLTMTLAY